MIGNTNIKAGQYSLQELPPVSISGKSYIFAMRRNRGIIGIYRVKAHSGTKGMSVNADSARTGILTQA